MKMLSILPRFLMHKKASRSHFNWHHVYRCFYDSISTGFRVLTRLVQDVIAKRSQMHVAFQTYFSDCDLSRQNRCPKLPIQRMRFLFLFSVVLLWANCQLPEVVTSSGFKPCAQRLGGNTAATDFWSHYLPSHKPTDSWKTCQRIYTQARFSLRLL